MHKEIDITAGVVDLLEKKVFPYVREEVAKTPTKIDDVGWTFIEGRFMAKLTQYKIKLVIEDVGG